MSDFYPAVLILRRPNLYIGSYADATSAEFLRSKNIGLVINMTPREDVPAPYSNRVRTLRFPLWDSPEEGTKMLQYAPIAARAIDSARRRGVNVLVHCRAGISRSASAVAAYLIGYTGMTAAEAVEFIKAKKPETFGGSSNRLGVFSAALRRYERQVRNQR